ncbi:unnamed protein product [Rhizophagus irregularis]|nr:unnamed protein product [Rhizophagus irregularis]
MGKQPHPFRPYFELVSNPNNKTNKYAVCLCCIEEYTRNIAITKKKCRVSNKAKYCRDHLASCENFKKRYDERECAEILSLGNDNHDDNYKSNKSTSKRKETTSEDEIEVQEINKRVKVIPTQVVVRQAPITNYVSRPLSTKDGPHFHQLFFNMVISNGLPFSFAENPETRELFKFCIPAVKLPSAKTLSGSVLKNASKNLVEENISIAQKDLGGVTAVFDGWTNVRSEHLFGVDVMEEAHNHKINIKCFVSDSAGEYAAARRQMRVEYKDKIFLPCMAHQMNLVFGDIFKESKKYKDVSTKAIQIVSFFNMSSFFAGNLRDEQMAIYKKPIALTRPGDTRWNSFYFCFNSLLKTEVALKSLVAKFSPQRSKSGRSCKISSNNKLLSVDIIQIVNDSTFWATLFELQNLLLPLCGFLNKLQKDMSRLHEVLHVFAYTMKLFRELPDPDFSTKMRVTYTDFGQWLNYYYEIWYGTRPKSILLEFVKFKKGRYPFDPASIEQFGEDIMSFWESCSGHAPELSRFALHIYGICVNAASVERLWSTMGFIHTIRRNRLEVSY